MIISPAQFNFKDFKYIPIQKRKRGNQGTRRKERYKAIVTAFDIETSTIKVEGFEKPQSFMYIWQWQFGPAITVIGRTWEEFNWFTENLKECMAFNQYVVTYVHNLSYEFQFLSGIYNFEQEEVFAIESRKVLKCKMKDCIEFRCSYLHTNMSLSEYLNKMGVEHQKGKGFDYSIVRYPWTPIDGNDLKYCVNDVQGLVEALYIEMAHDDDNLYSIPLTSTGYVRRDAKKAIAQVRHGYVQSIQPTFELYELLKKTFRGGDTHANRHYANQIIKQVRSVDISSSYPYVVACCEYPVSEFFRAGTISDKELLNLIYVRHKAVVCTLELENVELINEWYGCPYLSRDKCEGIVNAVYDNGRILSCDHVITHVTDIDLDILLNEYHFNIVSITDCYHASYGKLPEPLVKMVCDYYAGKTDLKGVDGAEVAYMKFKNKINAIYGMMAQDIVKLSVLYLDGIFTEEDVPRETIHEKSTQKAFLAYQWGVWTTARARHRLHEAIWIVADDFVYCDTDSVKYVGKHNFDEINEQAKSIAESVGAYAADRKGNVHYMGVYESEDLKDKDYAYYEFCTLGAKKYAYNFEPNGKTHVTIAGVRKNDDPENNRIGGGTELDRYEGLRSFKPGFIFNDAGGTEAIYNDNTNVTITLDGHDLHITKNVVINPHQYKLGIAADYERLLNTLRIA